MRRAMAPRKIELMAGESASVEPQGDVVRHSKDQATAVASAVGFVRSLSSPHPLIAYWPMEEGRGRTTHDQSGNNIDGWLNGDIGWVQGKFGAAVRRQENGYIYFRTSSRLAFGVGDFTIALWFKGKEIHDWRWLFNYRFNDSGGSGDEWSLDIAVQRGRLRVGLGKWFTDVVKNPATVMNETDWYHIAVARENVS